MFSPLIIVTTDINARLLDSTLGNIDNANWIKILCINNIN